MTMNQDDLLLSLENNLANTLKPVSPSTSFVHTTRRRLSFASPVVAVQRASDRQYMLIALTSVLSIAVLVITATRALFYLMGRSR